MFIIMSDDAAKAFYSLAASQHNDMRQVAKKDYYNEKYSF